MAYLSNVNEVKIDVIKAADAQSSSGVSGDTVAYATDTMASHVTIQ